LEEQVRTLQDFRQSQASIGVGNFTDPQGPAILNLRWTFKTDPSSHIPAGLTFASGRFTQAAVRYPSGTAVL
jgi:hypothetical protein